MTDENGNGNGIASLNRRVGWLVQILNGTSDNPIGLRTKVELAERDRDGLQKQIDQINNRHKWIMGLVSGGVLLGLAQLLTRVTN